MIKRAVILLTMIFASGWASGEKPLRNADVITLVAAGLSAEAITDKIMLSSTAFDTSTAALVDLKQAAVPDSVIRAMLKRQARMSQPPAQPGPPSGSPAPSRQPQTEQSAALTPPSPKPPAPSPSPRTSTPAKGKRRFDADIHRSRYARCPGEIQLDASGIEAQRCRDLDFKIPWKDVLSVCYTFEFVGRMKITTALKGYEISTSTPIGMKAIRKQVERFAPSLKVISTCK